MNEELQPGTSSQPEAPAQWLMIHEANNVELEGVCGRLLELENRLEFILMTTPPSEAKQPEPEPAARTQLVDAFATTNDKIVKVRALIDRIHTRINA